MPQIKRSVAGIACKEGRFFIARRKAGGDLGGKWEFPGGKAEEGESDQAALLREYREEFGLSITAGPLLASASFEHKGSTFCLNAYRVFFSEAEIRLIEHSEQRWASLAEIETLDFAGSDRKLLAELVSYFKQETGVQQ
jgi:8-oxo-dGTP diphosphatase